MRHKGADIRTIGLPFETLVDRISAYISYEKLIKIREDFGAGRVTIQAKEPIDSCLKFWWRGRPQLIEWRLHGLGDGTTRVETRFGLQPEFRRWFWGVLLGLVGLFYLFYETGGDIANIVCSDRFPNTVCRLWIGLVMLCLSIALLLAGVAFAMAAIGHNMRYRAVIESMNREFGQQKKTFKQQILQSDYLFADIYHVFVFYLGMVIYILFREGLRRGFEVWKTPFFGAAALLVGLLIVFVILGHVYSGYKERLNFIILVVALLLPVLIVYGLPYVNLYFFDLTAAFGSGNLLQPRTDLVRRLAASHPDAVRPLAFLVAVANISCISVAVLLLAGSLNLARILKRQRREFFLTAAIGSEYRKALDFRSFSIAFIPAVFIFWLVTAVALYLALYAVLAVFELGVSGQSFFFTSRAASRFFENLNLVCWVLLPPDRFGRLAGVAARLTALLYIGPLLWIIVAVVRRRVGTCLLNIRLIRADRKRKTAGELGKLVGQCLQIAMESGVKPPKIVITPSVIPKMSASYKGFPYFTLVIFISEGCLKLTANELEGLISHEMFHVKNHSFRWYLLNVLSDYTLFGTGFLTIMINSYANELAADEFAVQWIAAKHIPATDFIRALEIMAMASAAAGESGASKALGIYPKKEASAGLNRVTVPRESLKGKFRFLFELYFGDEILSYIHPPLEERIARIKAIAENWS